jgi:hypothetical protein
VSHTSGPLMARKADGSSKLLAVSSPVEEGDVLVTAQATYARVKFTDGSEVTLRPNSQLRIDGYAFEDAQPQRDSFVASLLKGGLRTVTGLIGKRKSDAYRMQTVTATIGIRGTGYGAQLCQGDCGDLRTVGGKVPPDGLHVDVFDGTISVTNGAGTLLFTRGDFGFVENDRIEPVKVPKEDAIPAFPENGGGQGSGSTGVNTACVVQ